MIRRKHIPTQENSVRRIGSGLAALPRLPCSIYTDTTLELLDLGAGLLVLGAGHAWRGMIFHREI